MENSDLNERGTALENEMKSLLKAPKKEKVKRAPTEYNRFMSTYINERKEKEGDDFKHKTAFSDGAKKWKEQKELNKESNKD